MTDSPDTSSQALTWIANLPATAGDLARLCCNNWPWQSWRDVQVGVACSGGGDSMALLRLLLLIKEQVGGAGQVHALHVNHGLRGAESDADAAWCRQQCALLGVPVTELAGNAGAAPQGDGLEAAARNERYELLVQAAEQLGIRYLATGHTCDDQVETILFRFLRGSGLRGLRGMPRRRALSAAVMLVRPLLDCKRALLREFLCSVGQSVREDRSNLDLRFTRNQIRHDLLPQLRADYNSNLDATLLKLAVQADEAEELLEHQAQLLLETVPRAFYPGPPLRLSLDFSPVRDAHPVVLKAALRCVWRETGLPEQKMSFDWWQRLLHMVEPHSPDHVLNLPGQVRASSHAGKLLFEC